MKKRSRKEPRLSADRTPVATPVVTQMTAAPMASEKVTGMRSVICGHTSMCDLKE